MWTPGEDQTSPVHDHADAHCVMKILKGSLTETLYGYPCEATCTPPTMEVDNDAPSSGSSTGHKCCHSRRDPSAQSTSTTTASSELPVKKKTTYTRDQVTYISDRLGLHSVGNSLGENDFAVSLHLYTVSFHCLVQTQARVLCDDCRGRMETEVCD